MPNPRIEMFERLTRQYLESNPRLAARFGEQLSRLRAAERAEMEQRTDRLVAEVKAHQEHVAQLRHSRRRHPD